MYNENRFRSLRQSNPEAAQSYMEQAQKDAVARFTDYKYLADKPY